MPLSKPEETPDWDALLVLAAQMGVGVELSLGPILSRPEGWPWRVVVKTLGPAGLRHDFVVSMADVADVAGRGGLTGAVAFELGRALQRHQTAQETERSGGPSGARPKTPRKGR